MVEQILLSGVTPAQLTETIINGVLGEIKGFISNTKTEKVKQDDEYLTIKEACERLKCSEPKLWRIRKEKKLKDYRNGRTVLFKKSELDRYIQE